MHILKYSEWQSPTGKWYCNDVEDLAGISGLWWVPARMLEMELDEYIKWLIKEYQPDDIKFTGKVLLFSWSKEHYSKCHSFVLYINKIARSKRFYI